MHIFSFNLYSYKANLPSGIESAKTDSNNAGSDTDYKTAYLSLFLKEFSNMKKKKVLGNMEIKQQLKKDNVDQTMW